MERDGAKEWYYSDKDGQRQGPFSFREVRLFIGRRDANKMNTVTDQNNVHGENSVGEDADLGAGTGGMADTERCTATPMVIDSVGQRAIQRDAIVRHHSRHVHPNVHLLSQSV